MNQVGSRHKGDQSAIRSIEELDDVIRQIGLLDLAVESVEVDLNVKIQALKNKALDEQHELAADRNELLVRVQAYMETHRAELLKGKVKALVLNFGRAGWRKLQDKIFGVPRKGSQQMEEFVDKVEAAIKLDSFAFEAITIKSQRWVTKGDLGKLQDKPLEAIGLKRLLGRDEFFVEANREKLKELDPALKNDRQASAERGTAATGGAQ